MTEENKESSEVKEQDLAQEALDATAPTGEETSEEETSPADEPKKDVPVAKHIALRHRAQTAELEAATLRGKIEGMQQAQASQAPAAKSPLELEVERQAAEGIDEEDMTITPALYRKQQLYDQQVANQAAEKTAQDQITTKQLASANKAIAAHDDWQEVVLAADGLMTEGELVDLKRAGDNFGELAYEKALAAIERNKPETKPESKADTAPKEEQSESKTGAEKVPTRQEILKDLNVDPVTEAAAQL